MLENIYITCPSSRNGAYSRILNDTRTSLAELLEGVAGYGCSVCIVAGAERSLEMGVLSCQLRLAVVSSLEFREV